MSTNDDDFEELEGPFEQTPGTTETGGSFGSSDSITIQLEPDDDMAGVVGDIVPSINGQDGERHFVSPKKSAEIPGGYVILKATGVSEETFPSIFEWGEGGEAVPDKPLKRRVKRDSTGKVEVTIKVMESAQVIRKMNVWIVWCDEIATKVVVAAGVRAGATVPAPPAVGQDFSYIQHGRTFTATIQPASIITDTEQPQLDGAPVSDPPGTGSIHLNDGQPNKRPLHKWDISRQYRCKIITVNFERQWGLNIGTPAAMEGGGIYASISGPNATSLIVADYPTNPVEGNDDSEVEVTLAGQWGENSNPYDAVPSGLAGKGVLLDSDQPSHPVALNAAPPNGASIEVKFQFRAFCRLEINGKWYRIADFLLWRHHGKLIKNPRDRNGNGLIEPVEFYDGQFQGGTNNDNW